MQLVEPTGAHHRITESCRKVESRLSGQSEVRSLRVPLRIEDSLDSHPKAVARAQRESPAVYDPTIDTILVNAALFLGLETSTADSVLAHEVSHAADDADCALPGAQYLDTTNFNCVVADWRVCRWGWFEETRQLRMERPFYGVSYCEILALWPNEAEFFRRMTEWVTEKRNKSGRTASGNA
jgi:hypothetical protein